MSLEIVIRGYIIKRIVTLCFWSGVREAMYANYGRVGVIAETEHVTTIPEHSHLDPKVWNWRARGLGEQLINMIKESIYMYMSNKVNLVTQQQKWLFE